MSTPRRLRQYVRHDRRRPDSDEHLHPHGRSQDHRRGRRRYQSVTIVADSSVDVTHFVDTVGSFFASYYTYNDTWTASASSISSLVESMTEMLDTMYLAFRPLRRSRCWSAVSAS